MHKTEKYSLGPVFPSDNSAEEEISTIKQHLQNAGFSETDSDWLVDVFKRPDCFGDPTDASVFRNEHDNYEHGDFGDALSGSLAWKEIVQTGKNDQTILVLLFSLMLDFGPRYNTVFSPNVPLKKLNGSWDIPQWVSEFQKQAKFNAESLDWEKLIEIYKGSYNTSFQLNDLLPFLFPNGVPLNQIVDLDLLSPVRRRSISSNDFNDPKQLEFWLKWRFSDNTEFSDNTDRKNNIVKLDTLLHDFSAFSEDVLGDKIFGLFNAIDNARYWTSTVAFATLDPGLELDQEWQGRYPPELREPDAVILLTVDEENRLKRMQGRGEPVTTEEQNLAKDIAGREAVLQTYRTFKTIEIDTSHLDPNAVLETVLTELQRSGVCLVSGTSRK